MTVFVRPTSSPLARKEQATHDPERLPEELNYVKFSSLTWSPDNKGFFYQVCLFSIHLNRHTTEAVELEVSRVGEREDDWYQNWERC